MKVPYSGIRCRSNVRNSSRRCSPLSSRQSLAWRIMRHRAWGPMGRFSASNAGLPATTPKRWPSRYSGRLLRTSARLEISASTVASSMSRLSTSDSSPRVLRKLVAVGLAPGGSLMQASSASSAIRKRGTRSGRVRLTRRCASSQRICTMLLRACSAYLNSCCSNSLSIATRVRSISSDEYSRMPPSNTRTRSGKARDASVGADACGGVPGEDILRSVVRFPVGF